MALIPAAKFIPEFNADPKPPTAAATQAGIKYEQPQFEKRPSLATVTEDDAYELGRMAGKAEAFKEIENKLEEQRAYHNQQLTLERFTWAKRESDKFADSISEGLKEIESKISGIVARLLRPFLIESIHGQAIAELTSALEALLGTSEGITLEVSGPEDLLQLVHEKLDSKNVTVEFKPSAGVDVRVVAGQTVLETCLGTWIKKVEERLE